jgi:iron(III) transport system permease protein
MTIGPMTATAQLVRSRRRTGAPEESLQWLTWLITGVLVIGPIAPLLYASIRDRPLYLHGGVFTIAPYRQLLSDPAFWRAASNTMAFGALTTAFAVVGGVTIAILCSRTDLPGRRVIGWLTIAPIALPPLGVLLGWIVVWGPGGYAANLLSHDLGVGSIDLTSIPGMAIIGGTTLIPIVFLICQASLSRTDASLEDAARSAGAGPYRTLASVTVPMLRPAALNAGLLVFALAIETLGVPLLLGQSRNTYFVSSYLYTTWSNASSPDPPSVSAGAVLLLAFASLLLVLRNRLLGAESRFVSVASRAGVRHRLPLGRIRHVLAAAVLIFLLLATTLPLVGLALMSVVVILTPLEAPWHLLTMSNYHAVFNAPIFTRSIMNSLTIALIGAAGTTILVALATLVAHRSPFRLRKSLQFAVLYPRAIPGIVLGMGFFWAYLLFDPPGHFLLSSYWGILLAFSVHCLTLAYLVLYPAMARIGRGLDNAARSVGATWWTASTRIVLALMWPAILAAFLIVFVAILNDYEPALFLVKPGNEVMGVTMLQLFEQGTIGPVSALAMVQLVMTVAVALVAAWLLRKSLRSGDA